MTHRDKKEIDYYFSYMIYTTIYVNEIKVLKHLIKNVVIKIDFHLEVYFFRLVI